MGGRTGVAYRTAGLSRGLARVSDCPCSRKSHRRWCPRCNFGIRNCDEGRGVGWVKARRVRKHARSLGEICEVGFEEHTLHDVAPAYTYFRRWGVRRDMGILKKE